MRTFTATTFDRLIDPIDSNTMAPPRNFPESRLDRRHSTPVSSQDSENDAPSSKLERRFTIPNNSKFDKWKNSSSTTTTSLVDKKHHWTQISPALYATPESTPLPDSPSSFPPSPYIINHKRRGPRLMKSFSEDDVATWKQATVESKVDENNNADEKAVTSLRKDDSFLAAKVKVPDLRLNDKIIPSISGESKENHVNGVCNDENGNNSDMKHVATGKNDVMKSIALNLQQDGVVDDDLVDPQDSMSVKSIGESEGDGGVQRSLNLATPLAEFYDAWEELSSENGFQLQMSDIESEMREIRLNLLMEIEKRKQAEEALCNMRNRWRMIREKLSLVGLTLPQDPTNSPDGEQPVDLAADVCEQVYLARFVSNSIGRGIAKAEVQMEMDDQIKTKNSEIARLWDRLHYYEAVNQEMSQRNQEVVETARRLRQRRKRIQRWAVWGSIATALTLGSAFLAYSYFHTGKTSSSQGPSGRVDPDTN